MTKPKSYHTFLQGLIFGACAFLACLLIVSATSRPSTYDVRKNTAEVEQVHGIYVFTDCKPVADYEYIGKVTAFWVASQDYETVRDEVIRQVKKKQKEANAVILHFSGSNYTGDAIKIADPAK